MGSCQQQQLANCKPATEFKTDAQSRHWVALSERITKHRMAGCAGTVQRVFEDGSVEVALDGWVGSDDVWTLDSSDLARE